MIHFAYPNVSVRKNCFLGCGRFTTAPLEQPPTGGYELANPNISRLTEIHQAASQLTSNSASSQAVYEIKDAASNSYGGDSLDLAYFLALVRCSLPMLLDERIFEGDIWCTGQIDIKGDNHSYLKDVMAPGFQLKLQTFVSEAVSERLFIVPACNLRQIHHPLLQEHHVSVIAVADLTDTMLQQLQTRKAILTVQGDELPLLVQRFFYSPSCHVPETPPPNPYRGLFAFREEDAENFFGRDSSIQRVYDAVQHQPVVMVIGPSGCGKSSLIYAGLFPRLRRQGDWLIHTFRPGADPFTGLASVLLELLQPHQKHPVSLDKLENFRQQLSQHTRLISDPITRIRDLHPHMRILIFIDQFEELYTLCSSKATRHHFLNDIAENLELFRLSQIVLVITMRADFSQKMLEYRPTALLFQDFSFPLGAMNRDELRSVIEQPARRCGVTFEEMLTENLLSVKGSDESVPLPLLEFTLTRLWETGQSNIVTVNAYHEMGGLKHTLATYAERVYAGLTTAEKERARSIFIQLVIPGESTGYASYTATRSEVGIRNWNLVLKLADKRLLTTNRAVQAGKSVETVEIAHEALIDGWERLGDWIEQSQTYLPQKASIKKRSSRSPKILSESLFHPIWRFVVLIGIISAAIITPLLLQELQRSKLASLDLKRARTKGELNSFQLDVSAYLRDHSLEKLKSIQTDISVYLLDHPLPFTDGLSEEYTDIFIGITPHNDGWGNPFYFISDETNYCICSFGQDHLIGPTGCNTIQVGDPGFYNCDQCTVNGIPGKYLEECPLFLSLS